MKKKTIVSLFDKPNYLKSVTAPFDEHTKGGELRLIEISGAEIISYYDELKKLREAGEASNTNLMCLLLAFCAVDEDDNFILPKDKIKDFGKMFSFSTIARLHDAAAELNGMNRVMVDDAKKDSSRAV